MASYKDSQMRGLIQGLASVHSRAESHLNRALKDLSTLRRDFDTKSEALESKNALLELRLRNLTQDHIGFEDIHTQELADLKARFIVLEGNSHSLEQRLGLSEKQNCATTQIGSSGSAASTTKLRPKRKCFGHDNNPPSSDTAGNPAKPKRKCFEHTKSSRGTFSMTLRSQKRW